MVAAAAAMLAALVAFTADSLAEFQKFETGMAEVFTLLPGLSQDAMGQLEDDALQASSAMGVLPEETIPALYQALSAGVPQENVFAFLETANQAAIGGVTDLETAVDSISSVTNAYGEEILGATEASDLMFTAVRLGKTTFDELGGSLFQVVPTAAALGVNFGDITAALAVMTAQGVPTSVATTQLRQALVELSKEGSAAADTFERAAGVSFAQFIAQGGNLQQALAIMADEAAASNIPVSNLFGSVEAGNAALALTGGNAQTFIDALTEMENSAGATEQAAAQFEGTIGRLEDTVAAQTSELKILIAEGLVPTKRAWLELKSELLDVAIEATKNNNSIRALKTEQADLTEQIKAQIEAGEGLITTQAGQDRANVVSRELLAALNGEYFTYADSIENAAQRTATFEAALQLMQDGFEGTIPELVDAAVAAGELDYALEHLSYMASNTRFDTEGLTDYRQEIIDAGPPIDGFIVATQRAAEVTAAQDEAAQAAAEALALEQAALAEASAAFTDYFVNATQATGAVGFFDTTVDDNGNTLVSTTVNQESLNQAMYDAAQQAGASAFELAALGVATGVLSDEEAEAALKSAILSASVADLAAQYVAGDLSLAGLRTQMGNLVSDINNLDIDIGESTGAIDIYSDSISTAGAAALEATGYVGGLASAAEEAAGNYSIHFDITQSGSIPNAGNTGGYQGSSGAGYQQFEIGGWTGAGAIDEVAGFVHRNEFVLPHQVVNALGLPFLEKLRSNALRGVDLTSAAAEQANFNAQGIQPVTNNSSQRNFNLTVNAKEERAQNIVIGNFRRMERLDRARVNG